MSLNLPSLAWSKILFMFQSDRKDVFFFLTDLTDWFSLFPSVSCSLSLFILSLAGPFPAGLLSSILEYGFLFHRIQPLFTFIFRVSDFDIWVGGRV